MNADPVAVLRKVLIAEKHKWLAEREIAWRNPIDQNHAGYDKLMGMHHRLMREALEEAGAIVAASDKLPPSRLSAARGWLRRALAWVRP